MLFLVLGTVFGFVLSRSGAADYDFIQGMFLFTNLQLFGIIGTAVVLTAPLPEIRTKLFQFPSIGPCSVIVPLAALVLMMKLLLAVCSGEKKLIEFSIRTSAPAVVVVMKSLVWGVMYISAADAS